MRANRTLDTTGQDWANHLSHTVSGNGMIFLAAVLSREPDASLLRQAIEDLIALQPVLGCRFDETAEPPVWTPVNDDDCLRVIHADSMRRGLENVTQSTSAQGRAMQVALICAPDQTAMCMGFDHAATDGSGAVRCLSLLARCFQNRFEGSKLAESLCLDRSDELLYKRCGISDYRMALRREAPDQKPFATVPYNGTDGKTIRYLYSSLPLSAVKRLNGTVNDCLLAAYALTLSRLCVESRHISIHITADLRRYLEPEEAPLAANLSGMGAVHMEIEPQAALSDVLSDVTRQTALLKAQQMGVSGAAMMTYLRTLPYAKAKGALIDAGMKSRMSGKAAPILSNLGQAFCEPIWLGDAAVTDILALLPAMHAPAFMLGAVGYADKLNISVGVYDEERSVEDAERLLYDIRDVLMNEAAGIA